MTFKGLNKVLQMSVSDKMMLFEAFVVLLISKVAVRLLPFKAMAARLGSLNVTSRDVLDDEEQRAAARIRYSLFAVSANVPWRSVCMDQALAAAYMLSRRKLPNTLFLGVRIDEVNKKLDAHAWVKCNSRIFIGGQRSSQFSIVAIFSQPGL